MPTMEEMDECNRILGEALKKAVAQVTILSDGVEPVPHCECQRCQLLRELALKKVRAPYVCP